MLIILSGTPLLILFIHIVLSRILRNASAQIVAIRSAVLGYLPASLILWRFVFSYFTSSYSAISASIYCFIVYTAFAYTYFHFFNMSETARRIRILYEVYKSGALPCGKIKTLYKSSDIVHLRLKRLVEMERLKYLDGYYSLNDRILYPAALFIKFWRKLLGFNNDADKGCLQRKKI